MRLRVHIAVDTKSKISTTYYLALVLFSYNLLEIEIYLSLDNLQFLTWFENRAKNDMSMDEWIDIKNNIKDYLI